MIVSILMFFYLRCYRNDQSVFQKRENDPSLIPSLWNYLNIIILCGTPRARRYSQGTNGIFKNDAIVTKKNEHIERVLKNIGTIFKRTNVKLTVIGWKEISGIVLIWTRINRLEIIEMGENCKVLIYLFICKFCQFDGVGQRPFTSLWPPLETFQPVLDQEHKERNGDGTIGIKTNDLAEGPHSRTRRTI